MPNKSVHKTLTLLSGYCIEKDISVQHCDNLSHGSLAAKWNIHLTLVFILIQFEFVSCLHDYTRHCITTFFLEVNYWIQCTLHVSRSDWLIRTIHSPMGVTLTLVCLFTLYLGSFFECLENRDLENGDNRQQTWKTQTSKTKQRSWKGSKHCLCTNWEVSFFTKSIGESILKRAQNYHRNGFKFIDKLTDADFADSFDCTSSARLQQIKYKRRWNFIK